MTFFPSDSHDKSAIHVAIASMAAVAVALGIGRFAFTPLLPAMLSAGWFDIDGSGWLASANYAGYCLGALTCGCVRWAAPKVVRFGLIATCVLTMLMAVFTQFPIWMLLRFLSGACSAWTFIFAAQWGARWLSAKGASSLVGIIYTGSGIGILLTGLAGALISEWGTPVQGWMAFSLMAAMTTVMILARYPNDDVSDEALRRDRSPQPKFRSEFHDGIDASHRRSRAVWLVLTYAVPGFGYIISATFLPVIAQAALPDSNLGDFFWPLIGLAIVPGALIAGRLPRRWDNRLMLAVCYLIQSAAILISTMSPTVLGLAVGCILLGLPFTAISYFAMCEAEYLYGHHCAGLMGYATASYGVGQIVGPLIATRSVAITGSFDAALYLAASALGGGTIVLLWRWFADSERVCRSSPGTS
ncbi:MFS transporter [Pandoraea terrae]|uniref:MFS transporter n=1 Tax=Pandoraea terrae TaxID=1537710 RepID=A0A5E4VRQ3_9BURK|nr:YbfB/YjiJ family MFS transporter [Pandoraea terrae]VVE14176.1 MFS transporter [Pandoraea terrae]